jgi:hypothetical protein
LLPDPWKLFRRKAGNLPAFFFSGARNSHYVTIRALSEERCDGSCPARLGEVNIATALTNFFLDLIERSA